MKRRVVITGMGAVCGLGHTLPEVWKNALAGQSGVSTFETLDLEKVPVKFGGHVKNFKLAEDLIPEKELKRYDQFVHYALHSANEALTQAGLIGERPYASDKMGVILGVGMGGFPGTEETYADFMDKGSRRVSPFFIPGIIPNMASGLITIKYGLHGINYSVASACASSAHAIGIAATEIMTGTHDCVVTGGAESVICYLPICGFANMKALSKRNDEPARASRPFDIDRDGFVMGEGAGILVLEEYEGAVKRGANIIAEVVGIGYSSDAYHITAPHPEGDGAMLCMRKAIEFAGINPSDIDYINAHGTSTPLGDIAETMAIKKVFGEHAYKLCVSSTKSMTGHLLGAAGGIESVFTAMAIKEGQIPPTINLERQDPECDLNYVPNQSIQREVRYALNNSFGFGGTNSSLIFKKV